jgi:hypothetical protein
VTVSPISSQTSGVERLERIYEEQFSYVWNTLRRLGIAERHLEDVAHDVFVVVHRQLDRYDPARPLKPLRPQEEEEQSGAAGGALGPRSRADRRGRADAS